MMLEILRDLTELTDVEDKDLIIFVDGSSNWKNRRGGFGIIILNKITNTIDELTMGCFENTTISRMELWAMIISLKMVEPHHKIAIFSDSQYVTNCINEGWLKNWETFQYIGKKNEDLLKEYYKLYKKLPNIEIIHIRGHKGIIGNEMADKMAKQGYYNEEVLKEQILFDFLKD